MQKDKSTTLEYYEYFQEIYNIFNKELFSNELPNCIITITRQKRVMGYFSPNRWINNKGKQNHELALNPSYFSSSNFIEIFQTIVHEMVHLWQYEFGTPSQRSYHNKEWADKMESLGLVPSSTGAPGGKKTGQKMNDYPMKNGVFEKVCIEIFKQGLFLKWFDRYSNKSTFIINDEELDEEDIKEMIDTNNEEEILTSLYTTIGDIVKDTLHIEEVALEESKNKSKYCCECGCSVWGKKNLDITCNLCGSDFEYIENIN